MKKSFLLAAVLMLGAWLTAGAQAIPDPLCHLTFKRESGSNSRIQNTGTAGNEVHEYDISVSKTGTVVNPMKAAGDLGQYIGYTSGETDGYYWCKYDADDALGQAFASTVTWEFLFRLDKLEGMNFTKYTTAETANEDGTWNVTKVEDNSTGTIKFFSSQEAGGWSFYYYPSYGMRFAYVHTGGTSTIKPDLFLETGKFYHIILSLNKSTKAVALYVNGQKQGDYTLSRDDDYKHPTIGTTFNSEGMWFNLGGDPGQAYTEDVVLQSDKKTVQSGTRTKATPNRCENAARTSWVFAKIYGTDLSEVQATSLYTDDVKYYTEPTCPNKDDILMDAVFGAEGAYADKSAYTTNTEYSKGVPVLGVKRYETAPSQTITTQWNDTQKRYEMVCANNYLIRRFMYDPSWEYQMSEGFSLEVYCKANSFPYSAIMSPMSPQQGGGFGFEFTTDKKIKFNMNAYGYSASKNGCAGTQLSCNFVTTDKGIDPTEYNHYVLTFDKEADSAFIYVNGNEVTGNYSSDYPDIFQQQPSFPYARYHWIAVGGDTKGNIGSSIDYPWYGTISIARVWSKALSDEDVSVLYDYAQGDNWTISVDELGYATMRLPFIAKIPEGMEAYVISAVSGNEATLTKVAMADECLPYGEPVIVKAAPGDYTIEKKNNAEPVSVGTNLLQGTLASHKVEAGEAYVLVDDGTGQPIMRKTTALSIPACKAWLPADKSGTSAKKFVINGSLNGIQNVKTTSENQNNYYYNLQGQRVNQPQRGIYILNGRKVFVK